MSHQHLEQLAAPTPGSDLAKALLASVQERGIFINGEYSPASNGQTLDTCDPATGQVLARIANASEADIDRAVAAARAALNGPWATMTPLERSALLIRIAEKIEAHIDELSELEILDQGKAWAVARWAEIPAAANQFRYFAGQAMTIEGRTITTSVNYQPEGKQVQAWTVREPVGVVAAITPWNSPLVLTAMKLAPALAAGCTVVLKPAELTSLSALRLCELMHEAGLPTGVLNVITGDGRTAGAQLAAHTGVDKVAFTGSTATGRAVVAASQSNLKCITLELGGKSPAIVLPDADLELAIPGVANGIFFNGGQVCVANSRAYIHRSVFDQVIEGIVAYGSGLKLGHGLDQSTEMGPLVSKGQADRVMSFIEGARRDGASVLCGGEQTGPNGTFIQPTVITGTRGDMPVHCEEVFGPVLVAEPYDDIEEAINWANDSEYGLAGSLWTQDLSSAQRLSRQIKAGTIWINTHSMFDASLPIGGMKQSGYGRESGQVAMDNYLEWKTICAVV
ncbi:aldehyde dehydrogenase [Parahaliea maris]|uniref:Aldehyde dehydrogenase n=1 Tax=Parahaliea maris TaxID=2716870 RepID=A0A5C8ZXL4_9GAMM|nr:aldehyde dehydrogenase family protein [Parahaliea maris]TXS91961.1 aldehyde dehydrogenase [Parahaliea maris]